MKKILIVEDENAYLTILHDQLTSKGYEVIDARDGSEGLKLALKNKPDLILLDLIMPNVNGLQMLKSLRKFKWGEKVPVFILTNVYDSSDISEAMNFNVSKYVVKSELKLGGLLDDIRLFLQRG